MKFIKGEIYNVNSDSNTNIFMWGDTNSSYYINRQYKDPRKGSFYKGGGVFTGCSRSIEATPMEKKWLLTCIEMDQFIAFDQIKKIQPYEIY